VLSGDLTTCTNVRLLLTCVLVHYVRAVQVETSSVRIEGAWFQLFKLEYETTVFKFCCQVQLARSMNADEDLNCYPCLNHLWPGVYVDLTILTRATTVSFVFPGSHSFR
jgi:hypothetical protein